LAAVAAQLASVELADQLAGPGLALVEVAGRVEFPAAAVDDKTQAAARERLLKDRARAQEKLSNPDFLARAPAAVVERERAKVAELDAALARLG
jgi:valyl-tRNA synthetase